MRAKVSLRAILFNWNDSEECMDWFRRDARALGLVASGMDYSVDNYHWILDQNCGGGPLSSRKYTPGSDALANLIEKKECSG